MNPRKNETSGKMQGGAKELFYFEVPAPDLDISKKFYKLVFGHEISGGSLGGHVDNATPPFGFRPGTSDVTHTMIYLTTFSLEKSMQEVKLSGGTVLREKEFPSIGNGAFCQDVGGVHFALLQPIDDLMEHARNPKMGRNHGDLFFWSIPASDGAKSRKFYNEIAGWEFGEKGSQGGQGVQNLQGVAGGLGCGRQGSRVSFWFRVSDIKKTCRDVIQAGGTAGPVFGAPEGIMSECFDNQGVKFGLVEPAEGY